MFKTGHRDDLLPRVPLVFESVVKGKEGDKKPSMMIRKNKVKLA